jgi:hypothetical protein
VVAAAVLAVALIAACGDDDETAEEANAEVCAEQAELQSTLQSLPDVDADTTTVEDLEEARTAVDDAIEDLASAAEGVAEEELEDLENAYDDYVSTIENLDDDQTLEAAAPEVAAAGDEVVTAAQNFFTAANC